MREKWLSPKDETGMRDPTPHKAVKRIIEEGRAMIRRMSVEELEAYYKRVVVSTTAPVATPEETEELIEAARDLVDQIKGDNSTEE